MDFKFRQSMVAHSGRIQRGDVDNDLRYDNISLPKIFLSGAN